MIISQIVAMGAAIMTMFESVTTICIGRFLIGLAGCTTNIAVGKSVSETIPREMLSEFGALTNASINFGIFLSFVAGFMIPTDPDQMKDSESWRIYSAIPAVNGFLVVLIFELIFTEEPVDYCLAKGREEEA